MYYAEFTSTITQESFHENAQKWQFFPYFDVLKRKKLHASFVLFKGLELIKKVNGQFAFPADKMTQSLSNVKCQTRLVISIQTAVKI